MQMFFKGARLVFNDELRAIKKRTNPLQNYLKMSSSGIESA
jgi:hypothetical protein